jgi:hypothetical protein
MRAELPAELPVSIDHGQQVGVHEPAILPFVLGLGCGDDLAAVFDDCTDRHLAAGQAVFGDRDRRVYRVEITVPSAKSNA